MASEIAFIHCLSCAALCKSGRKTTLLVVTVPLKGDSSQLHFNHSQDETAARSLGKASEIDLMLPTGPASPGNRAYKALTLWQTSQLQFNCSQNEMVAENHDEGGSRRFYAANPANKVGQPGQQGHKNLAAIQLQFL